MQVRFFTFLLSSSSSAAATFASFAENVRLFKRFSLSLSHSLSDFASRLTPLLLFTVCVCFIQTTRLASRTSSLSSRSCRIAPSLHARKLVVTQGKRQLVWV